MKARYVCFLGPESVEVREEEVAACGPGEVLEQTAVSAVSAGTEALLYANRFPADLPLDATIQALNGPARYPVKYGYAVVGSVVDKGPGVKGAWLGKRVFAFHPHESHFVTTPENLLCLPPTLSSDDAVLLPFMETAVNLLMDGRPVLGERVLVLGQGMIGLLTTALLSKFPLSCLVTADKYPFRRERSRALGAHASVYPFSRELCLDLPGDREYEGAMDLVYEVSGSPAGLQTAFDAAGYAGRIVIGSWYGTRNVELQLGMIHRSRITVRNSQVSTISPAFRGAWTKTRRLETALGLLISGHFSSLVTHRIPLEHAASAYALLARFPAETLQVLLEY